MPPSDRCSTTPTGQAPRGATMTYHVERRCGWGQRQQPRFEVRERPPIEVLIALENGELAKKLSWSIAREAEGFQANVCWIHLDGREIELPPISFHLAIIDGRACNAEDIAQQVRYADHNVVIACINAAIYGADDPDERVREWYSQDALKQKSSLENVLWSLLHVVYDRRF